MVVISLCFAWFIGLPVYSVCGWFGLRFDLVVFILGFGFLPRFRLVCIWLVLLVLWIAFE